MVRPITYIEVKCMTTIAQKMRGKPVKYAIVRFLCNIGMYIISFKARLSQVKGTYYKPYSNHWKLKQRDIFNKSMKVKVLVT